MCTIQRFISERENSQIKTEKDLFIYLKDHWETNDLGLWECETCGEWIYMLQPINFAHILDKKNYPEMRLRAKNILCLCDRCHINLDHQTAVARGDKRFDWVFYMREQLKRQDYRLKNLLKIVNYGREKK